MNDGAFDFEQLLQMTGGKRGKMDVPCPLCGPACKSGANRMRKVLRVWVEDDFITFRCARCEEKGWANDGNKSSSSRRERPRQEHAPAEPEKDMAAVAAALWHRSAPLTGSLAETYLKARSCAVPCANLRFLSARGEHHPAMIARFADGAVTGVHLTRLKSDGTAKAGTDKDKIMLGKSVGQPIIVSDNPDRGELLIAEGIEDAASLALVTGWSAWAAGSAGRIPQVVAAASSYERIYLAFDYDPGTMQRKGAATLALEQAASLRPDLVPLGFAKALGLKERMDANKALLTYGADAVLAVIEWCDVQTRYRRREIGFEAMRRASSRALSVIGKLAEAA